MKYLIMLLLAVTLQAQASEGKVKFLDNDRVQLELDGSTKTHRILIVKTSDNERYTHYLLKIDVYGEPLVELIEDTQTGEFRYYTQRGKKVRVLNGSTN